MNDQITLWIMARSAQEAVDDAKAQARADGWRVLTVAKVVYRPTGATPAWNVTLTVKPEEVAP